LVGDAAGALWSLGVHAGHTNSARGGWFLPALAGAGLGGAAGAYTAPEGEEGKGFAVGALAGVPAGLMLKPFLHETAHLRRFNRNPTGRPAYGTAAKWGLQELLEQVGVRSARSGRNPNFNTPAFKFVESHPGIAFAAGLGVPAAAAAGSGALAGKLVSEPKDE